jgi:hypothetical protein
MNFPKFHGIQLAEGSWIENLHINEVTSDPLIETTGKVWINSTQKTLKFSTEVNGEVVVGETVDRAVLQESIGQIQDQISTISVTLGMGSLLDGDPSNDSAIMDGGNF